MSIFNHIRMNFCLLFALLLIIFGPNLLAQTTDPWADSVFLFSAGVGQNNGQSTEYFPQNVLGPPDTSASSTMGSADPGEILSLGLGGRIILQFSDNQIIDGPGPDFTVFENAFLLQFGPRAGQSFAEPAQVAVSADGITFHTFPFDSLTLQGCAGLTPTNGSANPTNPDSSGGDSFDLADIGIDTVQFIELRDITAMIINNPQHPFWDPTLSGFDLDAVVAVNSAPVLSTGLQEEHVNSRPKPMALKCYPNPVISQTTNHMTIRWKNRSTGTLRLGLFSIVGKEIKQMQLQARAGSVQEFQLGTSDLAAGVYFVRLLDKSGYQLGRFQVLR